MKRPGPAYRAAAEGEGNRVTARTARNGTLFINIHSDRGIGRSLLARASGSHPETVIVRLHLRGLEHFGLTAGEVTVSASVASHGDHGIHQSVVRRGEPTTVPIDPGDPHWLTIVRRAARFDVALPAALHTAESLALEWVDFYR